MVQLHIRCPVCMATSVRLQRAQLGVQDQEIRSLKSSLQTEQGRYTKLQRDTDRQTKELQTRVQQLLQQLQDEQRHKQRLQVCVRVALALPVPPRLDAAQEKPVCCEWLFQGELQECQSGLKDLEAELQRANNQASNAEHQLTQLSLKVRRAQVGQRLVKQHVLLSS